LAGLRSLRPVYRKFVAGHSGDAAFAWRGKRRPVDNGNRNLGESSAKKREVGQRNQRMRLAATESGFEPIDCRRRIVTGKAQQGFAQ
jgi:hypothetical protein